MNSPTDISQTSHRETLPRVLGPWAAFAFVIGGVVGSGIFMKPAKIALEVGDLRWIVLVWIGVGAVSLFGALTVAELASMFPQAGGPYVYLREAFGKLPAFLWGWTEFLIIRTASIGALLTACVIYATQALPDHLQPSYAMKEAIACGLLVLLAIISCVSTRGAGGVQVFTVSAKSILILSIVLLPLVSGAAHASNLSTMAAPKSGSLWIGLGAALLAVWWAYDGWINLGPLAEDVRDPQRNLSWAMFWGISAVCALYLAATIGYHLVMPMSVLAASKAPAADALTLCFGPSMRTVVAVGVAISTLGTASASLTIGPRVIFAMARDGLLPRFMERIHPRYQTPIYAIVVQTFWALLIVHYCFFNAATEHEKELADLKAKAGTQTESKLLYEKKELEGPNPGEAFDGLTNIAIFGGSNFYALAVAAIYVFRRMHPDAPRPYRAWGFPITPALTLIAFVAVIGNLLYQQPKESVLGLGLMAVGGLYYFGANRGKPSPTAP
jgi:APA family basic amino acid/polyamine antiporter